MMINTGRQVHWQSIYVILKSSGRCPPLSESSSTMEIYSSQE